MEQDSEDVEEILHELINIMWKHCNSCGKLIYQLFKFCPHCGKEIHDG